MATKELESTASSCVDTLKGTSWAEQDQNLSGTDYKYDQCTGMTNAFTVALVASPVPVKSHNRARITSGHMKATV